MYLCKFGENPYSISHTYMRFTLQLVDLTLCMMCDFSCILLSADLFQNNLFQKIQEYHQCVKQFGSRSVRPDIFLGLIWVQTVCKSYQQTTLVYYLRNVHMFEFCKCFCKNPIRTNVSLRIEESFSCNTISCIRCCVLLKCKGII